MPNQSMNRREFLTTGGALVVTFALPGAASSVFAQEAVAKTVALDEVDGFLAVNADGTMTVYTGKVDLGTGIRTAFMQIAGEELDMPLDRIRVVEGDTLLTPDQGATISSISISRGGMEIRQAAATARAALIAEASRVLGVAAEQLATADGAVVSQPDGRRVAYASLIGERNFSLKVNAKAPVKDPKSYKVVGKPVARVDIPDKMWGRFGFVHDFRLPGMLHARVIRPAAMGARLIAVDDAAARTIAGFVTLVRRNNFLAVVARDEWAAVRAARAVTANWSEWEGLPDKAQLWDHVRATPVVRRDVTQNAGAAEEALKNAARPLQATFDFAINMHGALGPSCAVAEWKNGNLTCWTASQQTHELRGQLAEMLGIGHDNVRCIFIEGSGCYGRNGNEDAAADAALIAKETGQPVRVQWSREDEHVWEPKGPPTLIDYRAGLDQNGNVVSWMADAYLPEGQKVSRSTLLAADLAGLPRDPAHTGSIQQQLAIPYDFPNIRSVAHRLAHTPFRPSWIRTPGRMQNNFGNEVFLDEIAHAVAADPLEFRIRHLKDKRGIEVLERVARLAGWQPRSGPQRGSGTLVAGRGIAYIKYELVRTYVAAVADVEVNRQTGEIRVVRFYIAHDCGQIINPDGLKNQIEGNVIYTMSRTLLEDVQFNRSTVTSRDWAGYPILRFPDIPDIVIDLIDRPAERPWGAGEPTCGVVPPAISNAVFDAVGARLRSAPFTRSKVVAAI